MLQAQILIIKIGEVKTITFADGTTFETAIRKDPVPQVEIHTFGAVGNDVGLKAHHGGVDKALFFMSDTSFDELTALLGEKFDWRTQATYGENFVVSELNEDNVCVGDRYQIGDVILEISQPRKPCERLSKNTNNIQTRDLVRQTGLTGWYVRIIQTGTIYQGDNICRLTHPYPHLTIRHLNRLLSEAPTLVLKNDLEIALDCDALAEAFKRSLRTQLARVKN